MLVKSGIYSLVKESNGEKEIFDFYNSHEFLPSEFVDKNVSLSTIDALTTLFHHSAELEYYTLKNMKYGDRFAKTQIEYTNRGKTKKLKTIWKDDFLNTIVMDTKGRFAGCINLNNVNAKLILHETFRKFERDLDFYDAFLKSTAYKNINNHNSELIQEIHDVGWKNQNNERYYFDRFRKNFTNYKEFREIYLLYKEYKNSLMNNDEISYQKVYKLERKNKVEKGQISMFD